MGKIKKKQLGGFGIDPSLGGLLNGIDLNNLNFAQVADLGSQIGGDPFNQAMAQDDPSIYVNSIVGQAGQNYANITNPLPSAQETQQRIDRETQVFDRFQQQIGNATGASMFSRYNPLNTQRFRQTQEQAAANQVAQQQQQGQSNATDAFDQFNSLSSLFNFIGNFEKGGKLKKMQEGGNMIPPTEGMGVELFSPDFMGTNRYNNLSADLEGKLQDQYSDQAVELRRDIEKEKGKHFTPEEWDTLRHAGTSMYMAAGQGKALAPLRMGYANLMGLLHEIKVGGNFRETVSDIRNNYVGSLIGALPVDIKLKEKLLKKAIENPKLLSVLKPTEEDMQDSDVPRMPPEAIELFIQQHQARERGEGNLRSIIKPQVSLPDELNFGGKAKMGYSDNSPFKNEPSIMIPSGNIDMSKTSMPILAIPDKGTPKVMQPKSGTHIFPDANSVMEIPMMQEGGKYVDQIEQFLQTQNKIGAYDFYSKLPPEEQKQFMDMYKERAFRAAKIITAGSPDKLRDAYDSFLFDTRDYDYYAKQGKKAENIPIIGGVVSVAQRTMPYAQYEKLQNGGTLSATPIFQDGGPYDPVLDARYNRSKQYSKRELRQVNKELKERERQEAFKIADAQAKAFDPIPEGQAMGESYGVGEAERVRTLQEINDPLSRAQQKAYERYLEALNKYNSLPDKNSADAMYLKDQANYWMTRAGGQKGTKPILQPIGPDGMPASYLPTQMHEGGTSSAYSPFMGVPYLPGSEGDSDNDFAKFIEYLNFTQSQNPTVSGVNIPVRYDNSGISPTGSLSQADIEFFNDILDKKSTKNKSPQVNKASSSEPTMAYPTETTQPVGSTPKESRSPIKEITIEKLPRLPIKDILKKRPLPNVEFDPGFIDKGEIIQDWAGVPNVKIISKKSPRTGKFVPIYFENETGERIEYNKFKDKAFPKGFQYPEQLMYGGKKKKDKKTPYYQEGGQPVPAGVQLEEDEMIITPNMDIMETAARDPHSKMDSKTVTDIIRPEDYVLSNKLKITRKEAEDMSLGFGAMLYREGKIPDMPKEHTIADLFKEGEKSMTLAEYGKRVRKKLPVTDKEDPFSQKTNAANRAARLPYLAAAVYKNEMKRTKGKPEAMFESSFSNPFDTSFSSYSGMKEEGVTNMALPTDVQQMQSGGPLDLVAPIMGLTNFATGIADSLFLAPKRAKIVRKALEEDRTAINQLAQTQGAFSGAATGAALAGYATQDPTVEAPQYDSTQLEARVRKVPKTLFDYASGRAMAGSRSFQDSVFRNAGSFGQAVNAYSPVHAQNIGLLSNLGMQEVQQNIGLENQYRDKKQAFDDRQIYSDTFAKNATRGNRNSLTAGVAGTLSGGITNMGSIESNRQNALRQNKLQQTQATLNASQIQQQGVNNAFQNLGYAASTLPSSMFPQQQLSYPTPPPMNIPNTSPTGTNTLPLTPLQPLGPNINSSNLPYNQQGSTVPLGPNSVYDPATGLWFG